MEGMKNHLVEYKGGGYDGCFWEWNYFMWDEHGKFHNLLSTGRYGAKNEAEAIGLVNQARTMAQKQDSRGIRRLSLNAWNLDDKAEMMEFVDGTNASNVWMLNEKLRKLGITLSGHCYNCEEEHLVIDMDPSNWAGDGHGITYSARDLLCQQCANEEEE